MYTVGNLHFLRVDNTHACFGKDNAETKYITCMTHGEVQVHNILTESELLKAYPEAVKVKNLKEAVNLPL
jgi:hypothetical protein